MEYNKSLIDDRPDEESRPRAGEEIYHRVTLDKDYFVKSFIFNYRDLINIRAWKENKKAYLAELARVGKMVDKLNFNQNILFICDNNISKEVFLRGMAQMKELCSYYHCNLMELHDIFWGNRRKDNVNLSEDDMMYTEQDIKQDILCLYMDIDMYSMRTDRVVVSLVSSRYDKSLLSKKPMYNWIFFRGKYDDLRTRGFTEVLRMFTEGRNDQFSIYDLNNNSMRITDKVTIPRDYTTREENRNSANVNHRKSEADLSDIY